MFYDNITKQKSKIDDKTILSVVKYLGWQALHLFKTLNFNYVEVSICVR